VISTINLLKMSLHKHEEENDAASKYYGGFDLQIKEEEKNG
jgi:hypothetical protein